MYFNDESLQELGFYYDQAEPPEEEPITEADYDAAERAKVTAQANCSHEDASEEAIGTIQRSGAVELWLICPHCGWSKPTGRYDSVL